MAKIWENGVAQLIIIVLVVQVMLFILSQSQYDLVKSIYSSLQLDEEPSVLTRVLHSDNSVPEPTGHGVEGHKDYVVERVARSDNITEVTRQSVKLLPEINCQKLFAGDKEEIKLVRKNGSSRGSVLSNDYYLRVTQNCSEFRRVRGYVERSVGEEEEGFPLAFSVLLYRDVERAERLLRSIYRPWNHYCLHVDRKAGKEVYAVVSSIVTCLPGAFLSSRRVSVVRERLSVVTPELVCMEDLWSRRWRYFINLTGMELPIRTNWELVQILQAYNGANDILGGITWADRRRYRTIWLGGTRTEIRKDPPPHNITITKGSVHMAASRGYVDYVIHSPVAKEFLHWCRNIHTPDEMYFSSLNHNPHLGVAGGFNGTVEEFHKKKSYARFKHWSYGSLHECRGEMVRHRVCLIGARSLRRLALAPEMFANKFWDNYQPVAYDCFEQWHRNRTQRQLTEGRGDLDLGVYRNLSFVRSHLPASSHADIHD